MTRHVVRSSRGFEVIAGATPVLQVIFQYSMLLPSFRSWGPEGDALLDENQPRRAFCACYCLQQPASWLLHTPAPLPSNASSTASGWPAWLVLDVDVQLGDVRGLYHEQSSFVCAHEAAVQIYSRASAQRRYLSRILYRCRFTLQRRMRVLTVPVPVASSPREVLDAANPDAVLAVLLHKIVASASADGAAEGHALLHDWLCQLATQYNVHVRGHNSATTAEVGPLTLSLHRDIATCFYQQLPSAHGHHLGFVSARFVLSQAQDALPISIAKHLPHHGRMITVTLFPLSTILQPVAGPALSPLRPRAHSRTSASTRWKRCSRCRASCTACCGARC